MSDDKKLIELMKQNEQLETSEAQLADVIVSLRQEIERLKETNRELNRRNGELQHALARESGKGSWYGYYQACRQLYGEEYERRVAAEALAGTKEEG